MTKRLGIYVTSNEHLEQLAKLCRAADRNGVEVDIFFTHLGCSMMKDPLFKDLAKTTHSMALCKDCFKEHGGERPVPGFKDDDYTTQMRHCEMIGGCDRYLNF